MSLDPSELEMRSKLTESAPGQRCITSSSAQRQLTGCHAVLHVDLSFQNIRKGFSTAEYIESR